MASSKRKAAAMTKNHANDTSPNGYSARSSAEVKPNKTLVPLALQLVPALLDYQMALAMVLGGCCANAWSYEQLLTTSPRIGSALTFLQMLFITIHMLPSFLHLQGAWWFPRLKPRQVPLSRWAIQVLLVFTGSLLNNWAYAYKVPPTILIVFRSAGLAISMLFGFVLLKKRYTPLQVLCVTIVSVGVILSTLSRPSPTSRTTAIIRSKEETDRYLIGISMMVVSSIATGFLGLLQELTYKKYGPCWKEGVFYTHFLSLPIFAFLFKDVKQGVYSLYVAERSVSSAVPLIILLGNLITQLICVSGVNRLSSQMSSVSTNLVLTARKALSLCFSVWWFGNGWNKQFGLGAAMVFLGSISFSLVGQKPKLKTS